MGMTIMIFHDSSPVETDPKRILRLTIDDLIMDLSLFL